jgi:hypothetical protein
MAINGDLVRDDVERAVEAHINAGGSASEREAGIA